MRRYLLVGALVLLTWSEALCAETIEVVDGDTIGIGQTRYRLYGIDAPEAGQRCKRLGGGEWKCGRAAIQFLEDLVTGKHLSCEPMLVDDFGRPIAICRVDGLDLGEALVQNSLAWAFRRYSTRYVSIEEAVKPNKEGIWQADTEAPWTYRERRWNTPDPEAPEGCPIKGNISDRGRIYHAPWSPYYKATRIDISKGERWFCDEGEALSAGWRPPHWSRRP